MSGVPIGNVLPVIFCYFIMLVCCLLYGVHCRVATACTDKNMPIICCDCLVRKIYFNYFDLR